MAMEPVLRNYIIVAIVSVAVALIISVVAWMMFDEDSTREIVSVAGMAVGMAVGIVVLFLIRRRDIFYRSGSSLCYKLREVSSLLSVLAVVPTAVSIVISLAFPGSDVLDMPLISAIMIVISMIIQAVFWKEAENIGNMTFANVAMLVISLILLNVSSLLAINHGSIILLAISMFPPVAAMLLMYDWNWSADIGFIVSLACSIVATIAIVMDDWMLFGELLSFWIPTVLLFFNRHSMKATFLMSEGEKLF